MNRWSPVLLALAAFPAVLNAQQSAWPPPRPVPNPVEVPRGFQRALERGTRQANGMPGPRYWQQWASYRIRTRIDPTAKTVTGSETVTYHNRSPDSLATVNVQLLQNLHAPEAVRDEPNEVTGGMQLSRVAVRGQALTAATQRGQTGYVVQGTNLAIRLPSPLAPGDSVTLDFAWSFKIPQAGSSGRMGYDADNLVFMAYFYPQMAVYDDVVGWQTDAFLGTAEFYMGYGDYDYAVEAPAGWVVMGTGTLTNAAQVLPAPVLDRWRRGMASDSVVHVLTAADFGAGKATAAGQNGWLTWTFHADSVRDVAFSLTRESLWDAARTSVPDRTGDGRPEYVTINALWRQNAPSWRNAARFEQQSIAHHSQFTGVSYPYPHMTAVEGENIIGGGMEYPMMTLIGAYTGRSDTTFYDVVSHELAHMWFPMVIGVDERRYGWMDEGTTDFNEEEAQDAMFPGEQPNAHVREQRTYAQLVRNGVDTDMLRWTDYQYPGAYGVFSTYYKPSTVLQALRGVIGEDAFLRGYHQYARAWAFKHPKPWDFFNAFNAAAGRDLGWFWSTWYANAWSLDQAVASVTDNGAGGTSIMIQDRGTAPMPVRLAITRQNGQTERREIPVDAWLSGTRQVGVAVPAGSPVVRVEIDPEQLFPDVDRSNNVWTK